MTPQKNPTAIGLGEVLWDVIRDQATGQVKSKEIGGAPANFAYHATMQGMQGWVVSAVGRDQLAQETTDKLNEKGLRHALSDSEHPTGTVDAVIGADGSATYTIHDDVAWDYITLTPQMEQLAMEADIICFGTLAQRSPVSRLTINRFITTALDSGRCRYTVFDPNIRPGFTDRSIITESLPLCNILKVSDEELTQLCSILDIAVTAPAEECAQLFHRYPRLRFILHTCGADGNDVFTPDGGHTHVQAAKTEHFANTVGAGDSFNATFVSSLLRGCTPEESQRRATLVSGHVCSCQGAMPTLPATLR